jgi:Ca-activated chloride channel family protein
MRRDDRLAVPSRQEELWREHDAANSRILGSTLRKLGYFCPQRNPAPPRNRHLAVRLARIATGKSSRSGDIVAVTSNSFGRIFFSKGHSGPMGVIMTFRQFIPFTAVALATVVAACESPVYDSAVSADAGGTEMSSASSPPPPPPPAAMSVEAYNSSNQPPTQRRQSAYRDEGRESYPEYENNSAKQVALEPVSTFSIDVDTASYSRVRRFLNDGRLPPADSVRTEELVNYFRYDYASPEHRETPFRSDIALFDAPWDEGAQILRIGLKGFDIPADRRQPANLVFLLDTSGSMHSPDKLPLLQKSLRMLVQEMRPEDRVAMVAYAGSAGVILPPTEARHKSTILRAIDGMRAGGGTAGGAGIELAYRLAQDNFREGAVNRVILATDGDFNVGVSSPTQLEKLIANKRKTGIYLSVLGFGMGNLQDSTMQALAQAGNGNAAYIDNYREARKVLVDEMGGTLFPIADDVKIQIEFNPAYVAEYRLIGYETRMLKREDFNNDHVDAGEIGSGHTVTALYEIISPDSVSRRVDPLRYGKEAPKKEAGPANGELAWLKIRYKLPGESKSGVTAQSVYVNARTGFAEAPADARFATAVAGFGQLLRGNDAVEKYAYQDVLEIANGARGKDPFGYRAEFTQLVRAAAGLAKVAAR